MLTILKFDNYCQLKYFPPEAPRRAVTMNQVSYLVNLKVGVLMND